MWDYPTFYAGVGGSFYVRLWGYIERYIKEGHKYRLSFNPQGVLVFLLATHPANNVSHTTQRSLHFSVKKQTK